MTESAIQTMATNAALEYYGVAGRCPCDSYYTALTVIVERTIRKVIEQVQAEGNHA